MTDEVMKTGDAKQQPFGYFPKRLVGRDWSGATIKRECSPRSEPTIPLYASLADITAIEAQGDTAGSGPVGYIGRRDLEQLTSGEGASVKNIYRHPDNSWPIALYTRSADVAALQERVKELEGVLSEIAKMRSNDCPFAENSSYLERLAWAVVWCRRKAREATQGGGLLT